MVSPDKASHDERRAARAPGVATPMDMSDADVAAEMKSESLLNRVRRAFSAAVARAEQAQLQRMLSIFDVRRAEFCAARNFITIVHADEVETEAALREELRVARETASALAKAADKVLNGFEQGVFVRSINRDSRPDWAVRELPWIQALGALSSLVKEVKEAQSSREPHRDDDPIHEG